MIDALEQIDRSIVLAVNSCHTPFLDDLFWLISGKITWIPLYILLFFLAQRKLNLRPFLFFILFTILSIVVADLVSVHFFKNVFERYRPSHHALLTDILHFHRFENGDVYKGGMYGFVSSHAANFSALACFIGLSLKKFYPKLPFILIGIVVLICYSRIYLGVHYLTDILAGLMVGTGIGYVFYRFFNRNFLAKLSH
ncbi:MAG: phosphatase PAP2 family protein [Bacteroidota bacterium]